MYRLRSAWVEDDKIIKTEEYSEYEPHGKHPISLENIAAQVRDS